MRPDNLRTKIFLDSGDPEETTRAQALLGFLDGQTTNPSLIAKSPRAKKRLKDGKKFSVSEVKDFYKDIVQDIEKRIGAQSISIEVVATPETCAQEIIDQAHDMCSWVTHPHIKIPITTEGLRAGEVLSAEGIHLNFTLNFSQLQAAAVHAATRGAKQEAIYISPFHGRLDDVNVRGQDVIDNITKMYREQNSHVQVLTASVRDYDSFAYALSHGDDIITVPLQILEQWVQHGMEVLTDVPSVHEDRSYTRVPYEEIDLSGKWETYDLDHVLTTQGITKFTDDWYEIVQR